MHPHWIPITYLLKNLNQLLPLPLIGMLLIPHPLYVQAAGGSRNKEIDLTTEDSQEQVASERANKVRVDARWLCW
jgi:hypothetical protein